MNKFKQFVKDEIEDYKMLLTNISSVSVSLFVVSVVLMNFLANKECQVPVLGPVLDCGVIVSWLSFLSMDMLTKHYGAKASIKISLLAIGVNLLASLIFLIVSKVPGNWGEFYSMGMSDINIALDNTIAGTGYVLFGSTIAFAISAILNSVVNEFIGNRCKKDNFVSYAARSYLSTIVGQFADNMIFALIVSTVLFGWTLRQCLLCATIQCIIEVLFEVVFSPIGYRVCNKWTQNEVGKPYFDYLKRKGQLT